LNFEIALHGGVPVALKEELCSAVLH
jgi:hypothetical protein